MLHHTTSVRIIFHEGLWEGKGDVQGGGGFKNGRQQEENERQI